MRTRLGAIPLLLVALAGCTPPAPLMPNGRSGSSAPTTTTATFEVALLPEGFVPIHVDRYTMDFSDTNVVGGSEYVSIQLQASDLSLDGWPSTPAMVNGQPAKVFVAEDSFIRVVVSLPEGAALRVKASAGLNLTRARSCGWPRASQSPSTRSPG